MSKLTIESLAPDPCAVHAGSFFQERCSARDIEGDLSPEERIVAALALDSPPSNSGKLPADDKQTVRFVSGPSAEDVRAFWENALRNSRVRGAELAGERSDEPLTAAPFCRHLATEIHLPPLRKTMIGLGMGGVGRVAQFATGFPIIGSASEAGAYPRKGGPPAPIPRSELLEAAPGRRRAVCPREFPHMIHLCGRKF